MIAVRMPAHPYNAYNRKNQLTEFCYILARKIKNAPQNGMVEVDAGDFAGLLPVVFQALEERSDVSMKLQTRNGPIIIPAGAHLLSKITGGRTVTFTEIKGLI